MQKVLPSLPRPPKIPPGIVNSPPSLISLIFGMGSNKRKQIIKKTKKNIISQKLIAPYVRKPQRQAVISAEGKETNETNKPKKGAADETGWSKQKDDHQGSTTASNPHASLRRQSSPVHSQLLKRSIFASFLF